MAVDLGIDLGTSTTLICNDSGEILLNEPSLVIRSDTSGQPVAIGSAASDMIGRTPEGVSAIMPVQGGAITAYSATAAMLKYFVKKASGGTFSRVRAVMSVPCGISEVERRAAYEAAQAAGIRDVALIEAPLAAAAGCGVDIGAPMGYMLVNIGAGICEAAVVSLGGIVVSHSVRTAGASFDSAIVQYVKKQYGTVIGDSTAESIKISIGSVYAGIESETLEVNGRDMMTGLPKTATINASEIRPSLTETADAIVDAVKITLEKTPPELAADILKSGIVLTGGGAMLRGLGRLINISTEIPVYIAENPIECVASGAGRAVDFMINRRGKGIFGREM